MSALAFGVDLDLCAAPARGAAAPPVPVSPPSGFTFTDFPMTISRVGSGAASTFVTDWDFDASKPAPDATIFVNSGGAFTDTVAASWGAGNNSNDGLSKAAPVRSLTTAITKANALAVATVRIRVRPGNYRAYSGGATLNDHFNGTAPTCDLIIEADQEAAAGSVFVWGNQTSAFSFAPFGATNTYTSTGFGNTANRVLADLTNLDDFGDAIALKRVLTVADVNDPTPEIDAAWAADGRGAFYVNTATNPDTFWVRLKDNAAPVQDVNLHSPSTTSQLTLTNAASRKLWLDRIHIYGGARAVIVNAVNATVVHEVYSRLCSFCGVNDTNQGGGFAWDGGAGLCVHDRSQAKYNMLDGFNYHGGSTSAANSPKVVEIDCTAVINGDYGGASNNATTAHDGARIISVGGLYASANNRTVHDIGDALRWMLGSTVNAPIATDSAAGLVRAGNTAGDAIQIWLDAVRFGAIAGSQFTIDVLAAASVHYANMDPTGWVTPGAGSLASYSP